MPISSITIEKFKGINEPIRVDFKPITLLFGPNSAGKSTIVQALHMLLKSSNETTSIQTEHPSAASRLIWAGLKPWFTITMCLIC